VEAFPLGGWKNLIEMEKSLTLDELNLLVEGERERTYEHQKFLAALKGIDLDSETEKEDNPDDVWHRTQIKAAADLAGMSEERYVFTGLGIEMESDDDED
jgi:hypothetical protein